MKKFIAAVMALLLLAGSFTAMAEYINVPAWAQDNSEFAAADELGLITEYLAPKDMSGSITRLEFCSVAVRLYQVTTGNYGFGTDLASPFTDVNDGYVSAAYTLGIVSGYEDGTFRPDNNITRQEMFTMLRNLMILLGSAPVLDDGDIDGLLSRFDDGSDVHAWARSATAAAVHRGITTGDVIDGKTLLSPHAHTTRTQAVIMAHRFSQSVVSSGSSSSSSGNTGSSLPEGVLQPGTALTSWGYDADTGAKREFIFGSADAPNYQSEEEAAAHMTDIEIPVWKLGDDGSKYSSTLWLTVNEKIAPTVLQIFTEIFNSPEQFPIKNVGGYSWRGDGTSEHNWGLAIDINWEENYYISLRTGSTSGSYWLPGEDPYSIPENSDVVNIFHNYGFGWGGDGWWSSVRDYMHFSFLST